MALARRVPQFRIRGQMYTHEGAYAYLRSPISALTDVQVPSSGLRPKSPPIAEVSRTLRPERFLCWPAESRREP